MYPQGPEPQDTLLWSAAECRYAIEIPRPLLEELNGRVIDGFRRLSRGGIEVGGILFGRRSENRLRIHAWRESACEHARGPGFILSNTDRQSLVQQLEAADADPQLQVLEPLGLFVSHTKAGLSLTDEDLELYNRFFPEPWQIALVLHPQKGAHTHAGFFVRELDGMVRRERSYREFVIEGVREVKVERPASPSEPARPEIEEPQTTPRPTQSRLLPPPIPPRSNRLPIAAAVLAVILVALVGVPKLLRSSQPPKPLEAVNLRLLDDQGHLQIEWDRNSPLIQAADRAILEITDAGKVSPVELDAPSIRQGRILYARLSSDVTVRLTLQQGGKETWKELARSFGAPVPHQESQELQQAREHRAKLETEAAALREKIEREIERTQDLEKAVRKLETPAPRKKR